MHLISLIPHFIDEKGHSLAYSEALCEAANKIGFPFRGYCHRKMSLALKEGEWHRHFDLKGKTPLATLWRSLMDHGRLFWQLPAGSHTLFLDSYSSIELLGLVFASLLSRRANRWICACMFRYGPKERPLFGMVARFLRWRFGSRFLALTDSVLIQESLQEEMGVKAIVLPIPHVREFRDAKWERGTLWWPGEPRPSKGPTEVQHLAQCIAAGGSSLRILAAKSVGVSAEPLPEILTMEEYWAYMEKSDGVLLPYSPNVYSFGTSGILVEAVVAGKVPLIKDGTWLAHEVKRFDLKELILDWTVSDLHEQIGRLLESREVRRKLSVMQESYRRYHSVDTYAEVLGAAIRRLQTDCS
jgi:hypothetical protein